MCVFFAPEAVVIDNPSNRNPLGMEPSKGSRSHMVSKPDLERWEEQHGRIPKGALVIFRTGWSKYWLHPDKFFGKFADHPKQVFPGNDHQLLSVSNAE